MKFFENSRNGNKIKILVISESCVLILEYCV